MELPFLYPFFVRALVAGIILGAVAAFLGVFVVIRRMSFFSDAIAHASLTGVALGLLIGIEPIIGALAVSVIVGLGIVRLTRRRELSLDTAIGVLFSVALALGVMIFRLLKGFRADLLGYLFGDILTVSQFDVVLVFILGVIVAVVGALFMKPLIFSSFHRELSEVHGVKVTLIEYLFIVLLSIIIGVGIKLVGVILVSALMIIPVAAAKRLSRSFMGVMVTAVALGIVSVIVGIFASFSLDTPTGPTIVMVNAAFFLLAHIKG